MKSVNYPAFARRLKELDGRSDLSAEQRNFLDYLHGWKFAYDGQYRAAISSMQAVLDATKDPNLRFRAHATLANVLVVSKQYEYAYKEADKVLAELPNVTERSTRVQGLAVVTSLYNNVGEFDLARQYANRLVAEDPNGLAACLGDHLIVEALYKSTKSDKMEPEYQAGVDACQRVGDITAANAIRSYQAQWYLDESRIDEAINLLIAYRPEVIASHYPRLLAQFDMLLASAYRQKGDTVKAKHYALNVVNGPFKQDYVQPVIVAYRLLYLIAKEQGDDRAALAFHEKYAVADKGYLDDSSNRILAYQRVKQEVQAGKLQIETLHRQNQVLKLQRQLGDKAIENIRLYIVLLVVVLVFIVLWAYQIKRSQMHFKKRSQHDDLTGVFNRLHFVELAESALLQAQRNKQELCIAVFDLDHFKAINDNHGHSQGDATLQRVVEACQRSMRDTDVLARIGGEEFALLMTNCGLHEACARAERLRAAIADSKSSDDDVRVSASFGIACTSISGSDFRWLMHDADRALYEAKNAGRNRIAAHWTARESEDRSDESSSKPRESDAPIGTPRPI